MKIPIIEIKVKWKAYYPFWRINTFLQGLKRKYYRWGLIRDFRKYLSSKKPTWNEVWHKTNGCGNLNEAVQCYAGELLYDFNKKLYFGSFSYNITLREIAEKWVVDGFEKDWKF